MRALKGAWNELLRDIRKLTAPEQETSTFEQQKEVIEAADEFDSSVFLPGYLRLMKYMAEEVNGTLAEATKYEANQRRMTWEVVRWNAKRQLLDNVQGMIEATLRERDRIVAEYKEMENARGNDAERN